jgi:hypothetical protein
MMMLGEKKGIHVDAYLEIPALSIIEEELH